MTDGTTENSTPETAPEGATENLPLLLPSQKPPAAANSISKFPLTKSPKPWNASPKNSPRWRASPAFVPARLPITLIRRRFAEDIKGEVLQ